MIIAFVWVLPAGAVISGFIIKFSKKMRPNAFQVTDVKSGTTLNDQEAKS